MFTMHATGRLAHEPELKPIGNNSQVCEFKLLSSRWSSRDKAEVTESVTFVCFGEDAERFASNAVKGQEVEATGVQETQVWNNENGEKKQFVKYRLTWFHLGRKPRSAYPDSDQRGDGHTGDRSTQGQRGYTQSPRQGGYQRAPDDQRGRGPSNDGPHGGGYDQESGYGESRRPAPSGSSPDERGFW